MKNDLINALDGERLFFDEINSFRENLNEIPLEFDYDHEDENSFKRYAQKTMIKESIDKLISEVSKIKNPKVIDVCCGPGWISSLLELRGASCHGYDFSSVAVKNAKIMRNKNLKSIKSANGKLEFTELDVQKIPELKSKESLDAVIGWSAFHHLDGIESYLDNVYNSLSSGGLIATKDDIGSEKLNRIISWFFQFILPIKTVTYKEKFFNFFTYIKKIFEKEHEMHTPMEEYVGKHSDAVGLIQDVIERDYKVVFNKSHGAFVQYFILDLKGSLLFKKIIFKILWNLDNALIILVICKGNLKAIIGKKH